MVKRQEIEQIFFATEAQRAQRKINTQSGCSSVPRQTIRENVVLLRVFREADRKVEPDLRVVEQAQMFTQESVVI